MTRCETLAGRAARTFAARLTRDPDAMRRPVCRIAGLTEVPPSWKSVWEIRDGRIASSLEFFAPGSGDDVTAQLL